MDEPNQSGAWQAQRAWTALERGASTTEFWVISAVVLVLAALGQCILLTGEQAEEIYLVSMLMAAPVAFVRRLPRTAAAVATLATVTFSSEELSTPPVASVVGLMLVAGTAAFEVSGRRSFVFGLPLFALVIGSVLAVNAASPMNGDDPGATSFLLLVLTVGAMTFGALYRSRHAIALQRDASLEAHAATLREQSLIEERTRIARELHDVVAHHISSIAIQAETARYTTPGLPELGADRFSAIGDSARAALDEMRRLLGVMRSPVESVELAPQPGLDELNQLIDEARSLGATVRFNVSGNVARLPGDVELVAYRVTQEALTNARRHALGAPIDVRLDYGADVLRVTIRDHGAGTAGAPSADSSGFGLIGMRERVAAVGGTLVQRDHPDGGFEVAACIPTREAS